MLELDVSNSSVPPIEKDNEGLWKGAHGYTRVAPFNGSSGEDRVIKFLCDWITNMTLVIESRLLWVPCLGLKDLASSICLEMCPANLRVPPLPSTVTAAAEPGMVSPPELQWSELSRAVAEATLLRWCLKGHQPLVPSLVAAMTVYFWKTREICLMLDELSWVCS